MEKRDLGATGLKIAPLVFGGNAFGWTLDEAHSFAVLDAFVDQGFNAIDTADAYQIWVPGNKGGESETILGNWFESRPGMREKVVLFTKVGMPMGGDKDGLSAHRIQQGIEESLARLKTDYVDLYISHKPDPKTPIEETLEAFGSLMKQGKVRAIGASNVTADQLAEAMTTAERDGLQPYQVIEPEYNLYDRSSFEGPLRDLCVKKALGVVTYYSLASGFLTGKYRKREDLAQGKRGPRIERYLEPRGMKVLAGIEKVAARNNATMASVALAWLMASDGVTAPIASATSAQQIQSFVAATALKLTADDLKQLDEAGV